MNQAPTTSPVVDERRPAGFGGLVNATAVAATGAFLATGSTAIAALVTGAGTAIAMVMLVRQSGRRN